MSLSIDSQVYTDFNGLAALRAAGKDRSPEAIRAVAQQFESLFVQMMVKEMRATLPDDGLFSSEQTRFYESLYDKQLSMELSRGQGIGLADVIARQLGAEEEGGFVDARHDQQVFPVFSGPAKPVGPVSAALPTRPAFRGDWQPQNPAEFVAGLLPHARRTASELNISPQAVLAQAALETGWGKRIPRDELGSSFNLFGIKEHRDWNGAVVSVPTIEFENGVPERRVERFRAYGSVAESFADYAAFLKGHPRYQNALAQGHETQNFVNELGRSGYATDPNYARKINQILNSPSFREAISAVKVDTGSPIEPGKGTGS